MAKWLEPIENQLILINCASSSSPFVNLLSAKNRIVISSTKSGFQHNFSYFGKFLSQAIGDATIDLDKDGQISLLEMYLAASNRTQEFYKSEARLASEHALLDDNADKLGTPADWFTGIRVTTKAKQGLVPDGPRANQIFLIESGTESGWSGEAKANRDQWEMELEELIAAKSTFGEQEYLVQLEVILLKIAKLYESVESPESAALRKNQSADPPGPSK